MIEALSHCRVGGNNGERAYLEAEDEEGERRARGELLPQRERRPLQQLGELQQRLRGATTHVRVRVPQQLQHLACNDTQAATIC